MTPPTWKDFCISGGFTPFRWTFGVSTMFQNVTLHLGPFWLSAGL